MLHGAGRSQYTKVLFWSRQKVHKRWTVGLVFSISKATLRGIHSLVWPGHLVHVRVNTLISKQKPPSVKGNDKNLDDFASLATFAIVQLGPSAKEYFFVEKGTSVELVLCVQKEKALLQISVRVIASIVRSLVIIEVLTDGWICNQWVRVFQVQDYRALRRYHPCIYS